MTEALGVFIEGEPFLSRVKKYREDRLHAEDKWSEFARSHGATGYNVGVRGLYFSSRKIPDGWSKPKNRNGFSTPHKTNTDVIEFLSTLPKKPSAYDVFGDAFLYDLSYEGPNNSWGIGAIGFFFDGPRIGWAGETYFAYIPDVTGAVAEHMKQYPDHTITNGADKWVMPDGLRVASEAEINLVVAQFQVAEEKKAKESA